MTTTVSGIVSGLEEGPEYRLSGVVGSLNPNLHNTSCSLSNLISASPGRLWMQDFSVTHGDPGAEPALEA